MFYNNYMSLSQFLNDCLLTSPPLGLSNNPIPLYPPSPYQGEGGYGYIREASPLFDSPYGSYSFEGEGEGL